MMTMRKRSGFTLTEMAVVLAIIGILLTIGLKGVTGALTSTQYSATKDNLNTVRNSLLAFFSVNHRFPCPNTGPAAGRDGVEDHATMVAGPPRSANVASACNPAPAANGRVIGTIPYATLGLSRAQALDAYGNYITYIVDATGTGTATGGTPTLHSTLATYNVGDVVNYPGGAGTNYYRFIKSGPPPGTLPTDTTYWSKINTGPLPTVTDSWVRSGALTGTQYICDNARGGTIAVYDSSTTVETSNAVVVLISHGANGLGAWVPGSTAATKNNAPPSQPELGNTSTAPAGPPGYRAYPYSDVTGVGGPIDDVVAYIDSTPPPPAPPPPTPPQVEATGAIHSYTAAMSRISTCN